MMLIRLAYSLLFVAVAGSAFAAESLTCQEQLLIESTHTQLLTQKRGDVERQLSRVAAEAQVLQQKLQLLTKERDELKAKLATLEPPAANEKPAERTQE